MFNGGDPCGPRGGSCDALDLCPNDPDVETLVLAVNLGECTSNLHNRDSIIFKVSAVQNTKELYFLIY